MTAIQASLFNSQPVIHAKENNRESEKILNQEKTRLRNLNQKIYDDLLTGIHLTGDKMIKRYKLKEYRRRIKDIRAKGVPVEDKQVGGGCKEWFIPLHEIPSLRRLNIKF